MEYAVIILLWIGFGISHSFLISEGFTRWIRNTIGSYYSYYRLVYNIISIATFIPIIYYTKLIDSHLVITLHPVVQLVLISFSTLILVWSFFTFDALEFLGIKQVMSFNTNRMTTGEAGLVKKGLYRIVRHPMYTATIVLMWSLNSTLAEIIMKSILTVYIVIGAMLEERKLIKEYGMSYVDYQKEVPMLVPFLK